MSPIHLLLSELCCDTLSLFMIPRCNLIEVGVMEYHLIKDDIFQHFLNKDLL